MKTPVTSPWVWRCRKCERLLPSKDLTISRAGEYWHWDGIKRDWCGPTERVEVRSGEE